jgi:hypothetical protein
MKKLFNVTAIALIALTVVLASCGSSRNTTTKRYPYPGSPYPYPDGRYPQGYPYPGNYPPDRYPDYRSYPNHLPPGQAKKIYRSKSAKVYAPGQRKKYDRYDHRDHKYDGKYNDKKKRNNHDDDDRRDGRNDNRR